MYHGACHSGHELLDLTRSDPLLSGGIMGVEDFGSQVWKQWAARAVVLHDGVTSGFWVVMHSRGLTQDKYFVRSLAAHVRS